MIYFFKESTVYLFRTVEMPCATIRRAKTKDYYGLLYDTPLKSQKSNTLLMARLTGMSVRQVENLDIVDYRAIYKIINDMNAG